MQTPVDFPFARYHVPILVKALRVMEFLAGQPEGCGTTEVAEATDMPKNSAFRILATLADHGYLARDEEGKTYRLERKLLNLGYAAIDESSLVEKSIDILRELRDQVGESVFLAVSLGRQGVIIEQVPGLHPVKVTLDLGYRFPMHSSAPGKALLAYLAEADREAAITSLTYRRFNDRTISNADQMRRELAEIRRCGYALDRGEELADLHCVGAAILNHRGRPLAAIWTAGLATTLPAAKFEVLGEQVRAAARRISARFGYAPDTHPVSPGPAYV